MFRLRPIADEDAPLVVQLRTQPELARWLRPTSNRLEDQLAWLDDYYRRPNDYYFVVEGREPEGLISLYNIADGQGEWGRWILKPGSLAAVESALLIYRGAFERLNLASVYCHTLSENSKVLSFHDSCGIQQRQLLPAAVELNGRTLDMVEHRLDRQRWESHTAPSLEKLASLTRRFHRGPGTVGRSSDR